MNYEHDIFISYRHDCPTTPWMMRVFLPELKNRLIPSRPNGISIFDDQQVRVGSTWRQLLHRKVASSRLLVPMLTPYYFGSPWCRRELALIMEREEGVGVRSLQKSESGLVVPIRLWDGDKFPERLTNTIQIKDFREYTYIKRGAKKWYQFENAIDNLARAIDEILDTCVPDFDDAWLQLTGDVIEPQLRIPLPRFSAYR
ncbi:MAG TPA: TIR domain-containing protein [Blastocatellia bacterium]|nr:TIR domain-containing protein [Blastocatellia bacterium]